MEKYFEDENSLTESEILSAFIIKHYFRESCSYDVWFCPLKTKVFKPMLDMVMEILPSPMDTEGIVGTNPKTEEESVRQPSIDGFV